MCGLLFKINKEKFSKASIKMLYESLRLIDHRGPDGEGFLFINSLTGKKWILQTDLTPPGIVCDGSINQFPENEFDICMAHKRLSIFDLSYAGHQPFQDDQGNAVIFNGEVYNFKQIRTELAGYGYTFKTETDTEVILAAYQQWNVSAFEKFNGMFSFVIWDHLKKQAVVVNDRYGVKPLYYYQDANQKIFVSEIKQLLPFPVSRSFNWEKIYDFLQFGLIDHDQETLLNQVYRFPNAHYAIVNLSGILNPCRYYQINLTENHEVEFTEQLQKVFEDAVDLRLKADVPTGIGASGGLDSSLVLYKAYQLQQRSQSTQKIKTVSAIAPGQKEDESEFIRFIEKDLSIQAHYVNAEESFSMNDFAKHIWHLDAPVLSTSFYGQWKVARLAKENNITVLLVGQGADETFAGYHHHFYRYCTGLLEKFRLKKAVKEINCFARLKEMDRKKVWKIVMNELKLKYRLKTNSISYKNELYEKRIAKAGIKELLYIDFAHAMLPYYLRADDRSGMAFSLETRHPFLDFRIVDLAFALPIDKKIKNGWQKFILREKLNYLPSKLLYRKDKKGFTTPQNKIEQELSKTVTASDELIVFCKKRNIKTENKQIQLLSLAIWMKMITDYPAVPKYE